MTLGLSSHPTLSPIGTPTSCPSRPKRHLDLTSTAKHPQDIARSGANAPPAPSLPSSLLPRLLRFSTSSPVRPEPSASRLVQPPGARYPRTTSSFWNPGSAVAVDPQANSTAVVPLRNPTLAQGYRFQSHRVTASDVLPRECPTEWAVSVVRRKSMVQAPCQAFHDSPGACVSPI